MTWRDEETKRAFERMSATQPPQVADSDLIVMAINRLNRAVVKMQARQYDDEFQDHFTRAVEMIGWVATNIWAREEREAEA